MATPYERNWTAHLVIASDHAGLRPYFRELETEMLRVLARVDDPREVREYIRALKWASLMWMNKYVGFPTDK
jgi:hypothetical protein